MGNKAVLEQLSRKNSNLAFARINEIAQFVGKRYNLELQLHFPDSRKIYDFDSYGRENIGIIVDKFRKNFIISREIVKSKAVASIPGARVLDAYMYEGKEGVRIILKNGRIEILPGSVHIWCLIDTYIENYINWLLAEVFMSKKNKQLFNLCL
ncbi:MAG TPA: hypothetical protein VJ767_10610 [Nitrososphaeraceae archaeon]|nr:hypothetical protein [Nitrososphaeraceae archaeon]